MSSSVALLKPIDYSVICLMLIVSSGFGIYFGLNSSQKSTPNGYFLADQKMSLLPVALSAFATLVSGTTLIGLPTEAYYYGGVIFWWCFVLFLKGLILCRFFIPLYYKMGSFNIYKFLEIRYNAVLKKLISILSMSRSIFLGGNIIYASSLVFSQASNINLWTVVGIVTGICIIYTTVGGMKGVMWADVIQGAVIIFSILVLIVVGFVHVGGVNVVWQRNMNTGRLDMFDFDIDPAMRHTFWTSTIGYFVINLSFSVSSQTVIQRFLTAPTIKDAQRAVYLSICVSSLTTFLCVLLGILIFAQYHNCDPVKSKRINNRNQLVSLYVMDVLGAYPLLPGLFFAGLLSAVMSTLSSIMNSLAAIAVETCIMPFKKVTAKQMALLCKLLSIIVGILNVSSVVLVSRFPSVLQATFSSMAITDGAILVLLLIGIFLPQANFKAVIIAFVSGILFCIWMMVGTLVMQPPMMTKPLSLEGCEFQNDSFSNNLWSNSTVSRNITALRQTSSLDKYFPLSSVSFMWISTMGVITCTVTFVFMMLIFGKDKTKSAVVLEIIPEDVKNLHKRLPKFWRKILLCDVYDDDETNCMRPNGNQEMFMVN